MDSLLTTTHTRTGMMMSVYKEERVIYILVISGKISALD